ncbi:MAG TPA: hypothetical protein VHK88_00740 [Aquihabitans sp.]|jgi:hypothetical protein|nr:hypothetical protein [Aquihabitans sp.]
MAPPEHDGEHDDDQEHGDEAPPTPVPPPPSDVAPSATGLVIGDEDDVEAAPPSPDSRS